MILQILKYKCFIDFFLTFIFFVIKNSYLPAGERCKPQTLKAPTGPYDRTKLLNFITEQGKNEKDWEEQKPYVPGEKRGKVWQPPPVAKPAENEDQEFLASTEWDDVLTNANESEIVELAGKIIFINFKLLFFFDIVCFYQLFSVLLV